MKEPSITITDQALVGIASIIFGLLMIGSFDWKLAVGLAAFCSGKRIVAVAGERAKAKPVEPAHSPKIATEGMK